MVARNRNSFFRDIVPIHLNVVNRKNFQQESLFKPKTDNARKLNKFDLGSLLLRYEPFYFATMLQFSLEKC